MMKLLPLLLLLLSPNAQAKKGKRFQGSLEFLAGFGGTASAEHDDAERELEDQDLNTTLSIIPALEQMMGESVGLGLEWGFYWFQGEPPEGVDELDKRLVMSPHLRARMSFPIAKKITFDAQLGIGPSIWTEQKGKAEEDKTGDMRFGWSYRFSFGGGYRFNKQVSAFASLGYYSTTSYGDDISASFNTVPLGVGLRSLF